MYESMKRLSLKCKVERTSALVEKNGANPIVGCRPMSHGNNTAIAPGFDFIIISIFHE
jgi:hypothetical protein